MPTHTETQVLPYTPQQMFDLVADVERYPEFLPWCRAARILHREPGGMLAELVISFKHLTERYTSRVALNPPSETNRSGVIDVHMTHGPFEYLENRWRFMPRPDGGTQIEFFLDFKFRSRILEMLIGAVYSKATQKMVSAFQQRAAVLYGKVQP
ncbi:MAG: type II toxin-antitoxin system RatA family toxin [Alphaproteobacteria bacterium]